MCHYRDSGKEAGRELRNSADKAANKAANKAEDAVNNNEVCNTRNIFLFSTQVVGSYQ